MPRHEGIDDPDWTITELARDLCNVMESGGWADAMVEVRLDYVKHVRQVVTDYGGGGRRAVLDAAAGLDFDADDDDA